MDKNLGEGIITTKHGEEKVTIVYKRKVDYSIDPYAYCESKRQTLHNKEMSDPND
jgi:hypothetical protein